MSIAGRGSNAKIGTIVRRAPLPDTIVADERAPASTHRALGTVFAKLVDSCSPHGAGAKLTEIITECSRTATIADLKNLLLAKARVAGVRVEAGGLVACMNKGSMAKISASSEKLPISAFLGEEGCAYFAPAERVTATREALPTLEWPLSLWDAASRRELFRTRMVVTDDGNPSVEQIAEYFVGRLHQSPVAFDVKRLVAYSGHETPMSLDMRLRGMAIPSIRFYTDFINHHHAHTDRGYALLVETDEELASRLTAEEEDWN